MVEFNIVYNINFILLYLVLSVAYMILTKRRMLISLRIRDLATAGSLFQYVIIGVGQSISIAFVEDWLLGYRISLSDAFTIILMFGALLFVVKIGQWLRRIPED